MQHFSFLFTALPDIPVLSSHLIATVDSQSLYTPHYPLLYPGNYEQTYIITSAYGRLVTLQVK